MFVLKYSNNKNKLFSDPTFFPGRCAEVVVNGSVIGVLGVLHPEVITKFELALPCACFEISIESFV